MDLNINVEQAQVWKGKVQDELSEVKLLLKQVAECCQRDPVEDDPILKIIYESGQTLDTTWSSLTNVFEQSIETIGSAIYSIGEAVRRGVEAFNEFKSKIGR